jgi:threonyl-tRNA synthetase
MIIPLGKAHNDLAEQILALMQLHGFCAQIDYSSDKLDKKIRDAQIEAFNYIGVIGDKEVENKTITVRRRDESEPFGSLPILDMLKLFQEQAKVPKSRRRLELEEKAFKI